MCGTVEHNLADKKRLKTAETRHRTPILKRLTRFLEFVAGVLLLAYLGVLVHSSDRKAVWKEIEDAKRLDIILEARERNKREMERIRQEDHEAEVQMEMKRQRGLIR